MDQIEILNLTLAEVEALLKQGIENLNSKIERFISLQEKLASYGYTEIGELINKIIETANFPKKAVKPMMKLYETIEKKLLEEFRLPLSLKEIKKEEIKTEHLFFPLRLDEKKDILSIIRYVGIKGGEKASEALKILRQRYPEGYLTAVQGLLQGGSLIERRAAVWILGAVLIDKTLSLSEESRKAIVKVLEQNAEPDLLYEVGVVLSNIGGSFSRALRSKREEVKKISNSILKEIDNYWEKEEIHDPILRLESKDLDLIGIWSRDLPDKIIEHISELFCELLEQGKKAELMRLIEAMSFASDSRLVPALGRIIQDGPSSLEIPILKIFKRIFDPRAYPILKERYYTVSDELKKVLLAGILSLFGDEEGLEYIEASLRKDDQLVIEYALESLSMFVGADIVSLAKRFLEHPRAAIFKKAVLAISRSSEEQALLVLEQVKERRPFLELTSDVDQAILAVRSRLYLQGKIQKISYVLPQRQRLPLPSLRYRTLSWIQFVLGLLYLYLGLKDKAKEKFQNTISLNQAFTLAYFYKARLYKAQKDYKSAIDMYRLLLSKDRETILKSQKRVNQIVRIYLLEVKFLKEAGNLKEALNIVDEVLTLNFKGVSFRLKKEVTRLKEEIQHKIRSQDEG
jgi:tetratricopeptide (TPR) repeat protein